MAGGFAFGGFEHFWQLVIALTISHAGTIERLAQLLRGPDATHRTNHGEFLWRSDWDESAVLQQIALDTLRRLDRMGVRDKRCYFIVGVGKSNRCFTPAGSDGTLKKLGKYGQNVLRRAGRWRAIEGLASIHRYRIAPRRGYLRGLGEVNVVFARRRGDRMSGR